MLEELPASKPNDASQTHLRIGDNGTADYHDAAALYPHIRVTNCPNLSVYLGGSAANLTVTDSTVDRCTAAVDGSLRGKLVFNDCRFAPHVQEGGEPIYSLDAELGTHLTNCTIHAPRVSGTLKPEQVDRLEFVQLNKRVRFFQLNTALGNDLLQHFEAEKTALLRGFIAMLKSHHGLEPEEVSAI